LATLLLYSDGLAVMPLVIVAVVVAYATTAWLPQTVTELRREVAGGAAAQDGGAPPPSVHDAGGTGSGPR
jgi:hypothetical protein